MLYTPPINTNLGVPSSSSSVSKHWATILSPSPSPGTGSQTAMSSVSGSPSSATPRSSISLPPLHTAVPMASLDSYRRGSDSSISPIQEVLLRQPPLSARPRSIFPSASVSTNTIQEDRFNRTPLPLLFIQTPDKPSAFAFAPPEHSTINNLKSPRKRADYSQLAVLTRAFAKSPYPSTEERDRLSRKLGMTSRSVQIWFQNRRRAVKVQHESAGHKY